MTKFSMVRARVDVELLVSLHKLREAFSKEEVTEAKEKKSMLEGFHSVSVFMTQPLTYVRHSRMYGHSRMYIWLERSTV